MLSKNRITLNKLISYIFSFNGNENNGSDLEKIFPNSMKSDDEFKFEYLKYGDCKNINDFPLKLKKIFDPFIKDLKRHGVKKTIDNDMNISLYFSILWQIIPDYNKFDSKEQLSYVTKMRDKLVINISNDDIFKSAGYDTLNWNKKDIINSLVQFKNNKLIIKLIADYLNTNIFILNISEDRIYTISGNGFFDLFRTNLFLIYNDEVFEPLNYNNCYTIKYNTELMKKLINVDSNLITLIDANLNKNENIGFKIKFIDLQPYLRMIPKTIKEDTCKEKNESDGKDKSDDKEKIDIENEYDEVYPNESDANVFVKDVEKHNNEDEEEDTLNKVKIDLNIKISNKMKVEEIKQIAEKLNIKLNKKIGTKEKNKTKSELIEEIQKKLKQ